MNIVEIKTQAEWDALPAKFDVYTRIDIFGKITFKSNPQNSSVEARENSSVVARENSSVEAWGNSSVEAWGNSSVVARENSSVEAWGNSSVEARGNSSVVAWGNSSVVARGNSSVEAWGNSSVEARGNSSVVARENVCVRIQSDFASVLLWAFAVAYLLTKAAKATCKSATAIVIKPETKIGTDGWLESQGIESDDSIILFKRTSSDWKTQENTPNETVWNIGSTLNHAAWKPESSECGSGKFHACSRPYFCDEFRSVKSDRYVAVKIAKSNLYAWPNAEYPHKIAFRSGEVLYECDRMGRRIEQKARE